MLILQRRVGESIVIGKDQNINIKVTNINGTTVTIGVTADRAVPVVRNELLTKERQHAYLKSA